jgi:hypothetical protein
LITLKVARARASRPGAAQPEFALGTTSKPVSGSTRFLRTTWLLSARTSLPLEGNALGIRKIEAAECDWMLLQARKRNVFARHSWENSFYLKRIEELRDATVIEVFGVGTIDTFAPKARVRAELLEKIAFISSTLGLRRKRLHQLLGISGHRRYGFDLTISPGFEYIRSSARFEPRLRGVPIDEVFARRFTRCGFVQLLQRIELGDPFAKRLSQATAWIFESRQDPATNAALIKTAIGLESLLIVNDNESLRGPLSERAAFILGSDYASRKRIAKALRHFYDVRSAIVHGGKKAAALVPVAFLEGADRLLVLTLLSLAANAVIWSTSERLAEWAYDQKWGGPARKVKRPFPQSHLTRALQLMETGA